MYNNNLMANWLLSLHGKNF